MSTSIEKETMQRVSRRILSFLFVVFVFNQLDRVNLSFAAFQMNAEFGFTPEIYGIGVGLFFVSYLLFEIPSNLLMRRFGARFWLGRIMITWGAVAVAMAFVSGVWSLFFLRFMLGLAEAGFVPGYIYYLREWLPEKRRGAEMAKVALAIPAAVILGAPLSGLLLSLDKVGGLSGWQWMFILEGLPSMILGLLSFALLTDRPSKASWLSEVQRNWLTEEIAREQDEIAQGGTTRFADILADRRVWAAAAAFFCASMSTYGIIYWLPQILKQLSGLGTMQVSLLSALPFVGLGAGMYLNTKASDRKQERHVHFALPIAIGAVGLAFCALVADPWLGLLGLLVCSTGLGSALGVFWTIPMGFLGGAAAAGGFALVNMIGNSAGFVSPLLIGVVRQTTGTFTAGLYVLAGSMLLSAALIFATRRRAIVSAEETAASQGRTS